MSYAKTHGISGFLNQKSRSKVITLLKRRRKQLFTLSKTTWEKQDDIITTGMALEKTTYTSSKTYLLYFILQNVPVGFLSLLSYLGNTLV